MANQLIIPIGLWGDIAPTHCISCIHITNDHKTLVTGCHDGQICLWDIEWVQPQPQTFQNNDQQQQNTDSGNKTQNYGLSTPFQDQGDDEVSITPRCMLFGHSCNVMCLADGDLNNRHIVSSSENGEMCLWSVEDGRCLETTKSSHYTHTNIQNFQVSESECRLFCVGYYSEILVIDPQTFDIHYRLTSLVDPDWISSMHVLRPKAAATNIVVIGLTMSGIVRIWTLVDNVGKSRGPIYDNDSKAIKCYKSVRLISNPYSIRLVLIVCPDQWQVYDACDFTPLCTEKVRNPNEHWTGGNFFSSDQVIVWTDFGDSFIYRIPTTKQMSRTSTGSGSNSWPKLVAQLTHERDNFDDDDDNDEKSRGEILLRKNCNKRFERLLCPPAMNLATRNNNSHIIVRGDSSGQVIIWYFQDHTISQYIQQQLKIQGHPVSVQDQCEPNKFVTLKIKPKFENSLQKAWASMRPPPCGILGDAQHKITASVYLPTQGRLVCGRENGSIIVSSATRIARMSLLSSSSIDNQIDLDSTNNNKNNIKENDYEDWSQYQLFNGHTGRINCLLYPHNVHTRYDINYLLSGGVDFCVCLWDLQEGVLLHKFCVHAGEITQFLVPPNECGGRVLSSICSVASDHSVSLLNLKEKKCILLASRHLFPVTTIKWKPSEDSMVVGCVDNSAYVWRMETGHLLKVVHGIHAEELLASCDGVALAKENLSNPALDLFRGLRQRNLNTIKSAAARGLHQLATQQNVARDVVDLSPRFRSHFLSIQGVRTNAKDQDSHVMFFDVEALIVQLLHEEYSRMSPNTLESNGLTQTLEYQRYMQTCSPESHRFSGLLAKVKDTAEVAAQRIQATADVSLKNVTNEFEQRFVNQLYTGTSSAISKKPGDTDSTTKLKQQSAGVCRNPMLKRPSDMPFFSTNLMMEVVQILLSLLHAWGLDKELDKICDSKLGLLRPMRPVCFGLISKSRFMAMLLPCYVQRLDSRRSRRRHHASGAISPSKIHGQTYTKEQNQGQSQLNRIQGQGQNPFVSIANKTKEQFVSLPSQNSADLPPMRVEQERARRFMSRFHWELSTAVTTTHLLAIISLANTLMSMNSVSFIRSNTINDSSEKSNDDPVVTTIDSSRPRQVPHDTVDSSLNPRVSTQKQPPPIPSRPASRTSSLLKEKIDSNCQQADRTSTVTRSTLDQESAAANDDLLIAQQQQANNQQQIKQGWSVLAALHCVLLPELVRSSNFKKPLVDILARRWQDRCLEVREAARALLLAELRRIGAKGRRQVVEEWAPFLPTYNDKNSPNAHFTQTNFHSIPSSASSVSVPIGTPTSGISSGGVGQTTPSQQSNFQVSNSLNVQPMTAVSGSHSGNVNHHSQDSLRPSGLTPNVSSTNLVNISPAPTDSTGGNSSNQLNDTQMVSANQSSAEPDDDLELIVTDDSIGFDNSSKRTPSSVECRRKEATAIVLLGVVGAEYGQEIEHLTTNGLLRQSQTGQSTAEEQSNKGEQGYSLAHHTGQALSYLLLAPPSPSLPAHTSLRRTAVDLIGRGFTVWEPYLDVAKVLLGLLDLCCETEKLAPSMSFGLPLTPASDSCRTSRHAISLIAAARPALFITTLAREVARFNTKQRSAHSLNVSMMNQTVLGRSRPEILRNIETLMDKMQVEVANLIVETMDITLHCLDHSQLKNRGLGEVFPAITRFHMVSYCPATRRIAVGTVTGSLTIYELRGQSKSQVIQAHTTAITACSFSPDGKYLASYSVGDNRLCFWLTATGLFGLGNSRTRCVATIDTQPVPEELISKSSDSLRLARLIWVASKVVILMFIDGRELRYQVA